MELKQDISTICTGLAYSLQPFFLGHLSIYPSVLPFLSVHLPESLSVYIMLMSVCLLSVYPSVCMSVYLTRSSCFGLPVGLSRSVCFS